MKKILEFIKKAFNVTFYYLYGGKYGRHKIGVALILIVLLVVIFRITGYAHPIWWKLALVPGAYIGLFAVLGLIYAWIVWPISLLVNWIKKKIGK